MSLQIIIVQIIKTAQQEKNLNFYDRHTSCFHSGLLVQQSCIILFPSMDMDDNGVALRKILFFSQFIERHLA